MSTTTISEREATLVFPEQTIEPELPSIEIPSDSDFEAEEVDYLPAPDIEALAEHLRSTKSNFAEIRGYRIAYWWKRKGGTSGGKCVMGKCQKTPALAKAHKRSTWTIWLAADHLRDFQFTDRQIEALVFHELLHATLKEVEVTDKETGLTETEYRPALVGHDAEFFWAEIAEYGLWTAELRRSKAAFEQVELPGIHDVVSYGGAA